MKVFSCLSEEKAKSAEERFHKYTERDEKTGCLMWTGRKNNKGYGMIWLEGTRTVCVHRLSYAMSVEEPGNLHVLHRCDTPACAEPSHLFLGTHADNMADMASKGRGNVGVRHPLAKLDESQVLQIFSDNRLHREISESFNISMAIVSEIKSGKIWSSVTGKEWVDLGRNPASKLSKEQVCEIYKDERSVRTIARQYGVSASAIHLIKKRKNWRHVTENL